MAHKPHHHGNLRAALIDGAIEILAAQGIEALSLRKLAHSLGVSHAAPAHHFANKQVLLHAVATRGFQILTETMREDRAAAGPDPFDRLLGICQGYLRFAEQNEALFELIFASDVKNAKSAELLEASSASFMVLVETCAVFEPSPHGNGVNEITIWSLVHGYATLRRFSRISPIPGGVPVPFKALLPPVKIKSS